MASQKLVSQEQSLLIGKTLCLVRCFVLMSMMMLKTIHHHSRKHDYSVATLRFEVLTFSVALRVENELRNFKSRIIGV
jgi:hypothetical protein